MQELTVAMALALALLPSCVGASSRDDQRTTLTPQYLVINPAGDVPPGMPARLLVGLFEDTGNSWMKSSAVNWDARYRYFTLGWADNWGYGAHDGSWGLQYLQECDAQGFLPAVEYYTMNEEPGGSFLAKTQSVSTMQAYFSDFKLLMQRAKDFGKPVMVLLEADGFGYLQQQSGSNPSAAAAVAATGIPELATLPDTLAGWGLAFLQMRKAVGASNVILGVHVSGWASSIDLFYSSVTEPLQPHVDSVYSFLSPLGLAANSTGATFDVLVGDPLDRDSDYYALVQGDSRWWDPADTAPIASQSFNRYAEWLRLWNQKASKRWVLWQLPIGNSNQLDVCNAGEPRQGYKDNRTEYFFGPSGATHREQWANDGVAALLFGQGEDCQSSYENDYDANGQLYLKTHASAFLSAGGLAIPRGSSGTSTPGTTDPAAFNFESNTQGWIGSSTTVATSTLQAFAGSRSLAIPLSASAGQVSAQVAPPAIPDGTVVNFHLFVPAGASLGSVQVYLQESAATNWRWNGNWKPGSALTANTWNTLSVSVPSGASALQSMGVQLQVNAGSASVVYLDSVGWGANNVPGSGVGGSSGAGGSNATGGKTGAGGGNATGGRTGASGSNATGGRTGTGSSSPTCMTIMPLGDSITLGVNGGYRNVLYTTLEGASCGVNYVGSQYDEYCLVADKDHEGHPGFTISDISSNADAWLASSQPDYVLLMIGTNDIAWWSVETGQEIGARHGALIDQILADRPNAWVVVATIPPITSGIIDPNSVDRAQLGRDLNTQIVANVTARRAAGKHVRLADVYSVLTTADLYDGVHPTEAAHAKVASVWDQALAPLVSCSAPMPACGP